MEVLDANCEVFEFAKNVFKIRIPNYNADKAHYVMTI